MKKTIKLVFAGVITGTLVMLGACSDDDKTLPKIDGYNNSNEVAADNLVAHWTFDGSNNERISSTAPSNTYGTVGFETGKIGQALKLTGGALVYPSTITAFNSANALNNFTVSYWVNVRGNKKTAKAGYTAFFGLYPTNVTDIWGDIVASAETARHLPTSDTLELKNNLISHAAGGNIGQDNIAQRNNGDNKGAWFLGAQDWVHHVMVWEASTNKFYLYANGVDVGGWTERSATGNMILATPVKAVFGSLASKDIGFTEAPDQPTWAPWATASIDDLRVFNTTLTPAQIGALYNLGLAGR